MLTFIFTVFMLVAVPVIIMFSVSYFYLSAPRYHGLPSDHFDGERFFTPEGAPAKGLQDVLKWAIQRERGRWESRMDLEPGPPPPARIDQGQLRVTFINHTTVLIQVNGLNILTDPVWSNRVSPVQFAGPKRMKPPGIRFEDLPEIDIVLLSHNHYDHLDAPTMKRLAQTHQPRVFTPLGVKSFVEKLGLDSVEELDWWDKLDLGDGLELVCVPAQHFSGRGITDRDATLWCGFVMVAKEGNIYFAGDTGYGPFFKEIGARLGPFRLSLIPIGAFKPRWFMSPIHIGPEEAVKVHLDTHSRQSMATHFGTFPLADDGEFEAVEGLYQALEDQGINKNQFWVLENGEARTLNYEQTNR